MEEGQVCGSDREGNTYLEGNIHRLGGLNGG